MKYYPATVCCLSALLAIAVSPAPLHAAEKDVNFRVDAFVGQQDGYHTYRIPVMVVTAKGTVLLFSEGRKNSRRDGGDIDQLMKRSEDGGKTWSKQVVIHEEGGTDDGLTWSPMVVTSDTPTVKAYSDKNFLKGFGGSPVGIFVGPVHGIQTRKGRLVVPCGVGRTVDGKPAGGDGIIYSDDGGKTWVPGGLIPSVPDFSVGEPTVVETSDGSLLMNMRAGGPGGAYALGHRVTSTSADAGITWSKPVIDKNLPCPACQGSMNSLNEKEILFLNPGVSHAGGFNLWARRKMTLRLSGDDGRTWPHALLLNEGLSGYSDLAVTKDGKILCAFENGKQDYCQKISVVQVDRAVLLAAKDAPAEKPAETQPKAP
ncbi:MAG: sialidase family protein [Verrucomicrobia bacterium]|nr:sialidase family protein [Verrucomicrobiota bacterium]